MPREEQIAFLKLEYSQLRGEYTQFVTAAANLLKWAVTVSVAVFVWLLTSASVHVLAWWLPFAMSVIFAATAWTLDIRNARKLLYLAEMEAAFFEEAPGVGFERHAKDTLVFQWPPPPEPMFRYAWILLIAGNLAFACAASFA